MPGTRKLGKPTDQRMAMLRAMVTFLIEKGQIRTTLSRAKEVRSLTDKMITLGKRNDLSAYRKAMSFMTKEGVVHELFTIIAPKFAERNGGYTRVLRLGPRRGDATEMALIQLLETSAPAVEDKKGKADKKAAKADKTKAAKGEKAEKVDKSALKETKEDEKARAKEEKAKAKKEKAEKTVKTKKAEETSKAIETEKTEEIIEAEETAKAIETEETVEVVEAEETAEIIETEETEDSTETEKTEK